MLIFYQINDINSGIRTQTLGEVRVTGVSPVQISCQQNQGTGTVPAPSYQPSASTAIKIMLHRADRTS